MSIYTVYIYINMVCLLILFQVNVYDLLSSKMKCSFIGHTAGVSCVNAADSPPHRLVTGCQDRKLVSALGRALSLLTHAFYLYANSQHIFNVLSAQTAFYGAVVLNTSVINCT